MSIHNDLRDLKGMALVERIEQMREADPDDVYLEVVENRGDRGAQTVSEMPWWLDELLRLAKIGATVEKVRILLSPPSGEQP